MRSFVLAFGVLYAGSALYFGYVSDINAGYLLAAVVGLATLVTFQLCEHMFEIRRRCRQFLKRRQLAPSAG